MRSIAKRTAWVCVLLTLWSAMAFAAHQHSNATESAPCTVCVAAHSAAPKTTFTLPTVTFVAVRKVRVEPVSARQRFTPFALTVRPPPGV